MSYEKQKKKITIKIVPHSEGKVISFKVSKSLSKFLIGFVLICLIGSGLGFGYYYQQNSKALATIAHLRQVKQRNKKLKNKLHNLSQEAKGLKAKFKQIQETNREIKQLIDYKSSNQKINVEKASNLSESNQKANYNQNYDFKGEFKTGQPAFNLLADTENKIEKLKSLFPKKEMELKKLKDSAQKYKDYLAAKPTGWPIKSQKRKVTSYFGYRTHPVTGEYSKHEGLDIGVWYGTKVYSTGAGKVVHAGWKGGYGKAVIISHGYGFRTIYGHNRRLAVNVGQRVKRGEVIAYTGNSGRSTGPHLHYEIMIDGNPVDPLPYIK